MKVNIEIDSRCFLIMHNYEPIPLQQGDMPGFLTGEIDLSEGDILLVSSLCIRRWYVMSMYSNNNWRQGLVHDDINGESEARCTHVMGGLVPGSSHAKGGLLRISSESAFTRADVWKQSRFGIFKHKFFPYFNNNNIAHSSSAGSLQHFGDLPIYWTIGEPFDHRFGLHEKLLPTHLPRVLDAYKAWKSWYMEDASY